MDKSSHAEIHMRRIVLQLLSLLLEAAEGTDDQLRAAALGTICALAAQLGQHPERLLTRLLKAANAAHKEVLSCETAASGALRHTKTANSSRRVERHVERHVLRVCR